MYTNFILFLLLNAITVRFAFFFLLFFTTVNILKHLKKKDKDRNSNIIHIKEHFYFRGHLCITFDLMSVNLYEFIKNNNFQGVSLGLIRRFAIQLLTSLNFLAKQNIIHCDLKPENILLKKSNRSGIRVIDLGSSCFVDERVYTYIQSRFYRSPEVILGLAYGTAIDMWSFACILAELYTGKYKMSKKKFVRSKSVFL